MHVCPSVLPSGAHGLTLLALLTVCLGPQFCEIPASIQNLVSAAAFGRQCLDPSDGRRVPELQLPS